MNILKTIIIGTVILKLASLGLIIYIFFSTSEELLNYYPVDFTQAALKNFKINLSKKIKCKCEEGLYDKECSKKQEIQGCTNINEYPLRNLQDNEFCKNYYNELIKEGKLSDVFDLNFPTIHYTALIIIILKSVLILLCLTLLYYENKALKIESGYKVYDLQFYYIGCFGLSIEFFNFILYVVFWGMFSDGNISEYLDFLDCPYIKKDAFSEHSQIEHINACIISFIVINLISIILSCIIFFISNRRGLKYSPYIIEKIVERKE